MAITLEPDFEIYYVDGVNQYKITNNGDGSYTLGYAVASQKSTSSTDQTQVQYQPIAIIEDVLLSYSKVTETSTG